jgi:hypothetical protein
MIKEDRFFKTQRRDGMIYGYESYNKLYDIYYIGDTMECYAVNCKRVEKPTFYHKAIEKHFNL